MKSKISKILKSVIGGSLLMGATISGAFAANDVNDFPGPFIKDGKFTGVLVVGDKAAVEDVIGVSDIAVSLQFAAAKGTQKEETKVSTSGEIDAWKIGTSTQRLELSEDLKTGGPNRETISDVVPGSFIDESELNILADWEARTSKGDSDYRQRLYFDGGDDTGYVAYLENEDDETADFLFFKSGEQIAKYELEFSPALESDIDDSQLEDFEDVELNMLGREYTIVQATKVGTEGVKLLLMGGSIRDTLNEGSTKTYTIGDKNYEIELVFVDSDQAKFVVDGKNTRLLTDGETDKLADGTVIGVSDILYQDYAGGVHSAEFFIGAQKFELRDSDIEDTTSSNSLKVDDETIDDAAVTIEGSISSDEVSITRISVVMTAEDDFYVPAGGKLSENSELSEPQVLFTQNWDIEYVGLSEENENKIRIDTTGSDQYELEFVDGAGDVAKVPLANAVGGSTLRLGEDSDDLILNESLSITKDDYFIVTDESESVGERPTFALRYRGADKSTDSNPVMKFDNVGAGERIDLPYTEDGGVAEATLKIGGGSYSVKSNSIITAKDFTILVDLDGENGFGTNVVSLTTKYGAQIDVTNGVPNTINVTISTPSGNDVDDLTPTDLSFKITAASDKVNLADIGDLRLVSHENDDDVSYGYTSYGAFVKFDENADEAELEILYPQSQLEPMVYVKSKGSILGETASEEEQSVVSIQRIDVGATKLASEVSNPKSTNLILVGGPCANAAVEATTPVTCLNWPLDVGEAFVRYYTNNGNVAMLVAGTTAQDTRNAVTALVQGKLNTATNVRIYTSDK